MKILIVLKSKGFNVAILSALGIVTTLLFQIATARFLSPSEYGLVAAFLAIVNIAAIGAVALQNAVTVQVAKKEIVSKRNSVNFNSTRSKIMFNKFDATTVEAAGLGLGGALILLLFYKPLSDQLDTQPIVLVAAAATIPMSFFISRDLGILQGSEKTVATVMWSTLSAILRLVLVLVLVLTYQSAGAAILGVFLALTITFTALWVQVRRTNYKSIHRPFSLASLSVILMSILFAWLTNIEIVFVRALIPSADSGNYAVAASLIKASLIIPGTISLFLLPKLAKQRGNSLGKPLFATLIFSFAAIILFTGLMYFYGSVLFSLVFGSQYQLSNEFLATVSFTFLPWLLAQALLIKLNAQARFIGIPILVAVAVAQSLMFYQTLPNLEVTIWGNGLIGITCFTLMLLLLFLKKKDGAQLN
jgi:O-antigen/teichoic acid export membrane protein